MRTWILRAATVVAAAAVTSLALPAPAQSGIYTWRLVATYPNAAACQIAGPQQAAAQDADTWRCTPVSSGVRLFLGFIW